MSEDTAVSVNFEVFGKVQGVFFRRFTKLTATKLGLVGWCKNTVDGTVVGQIQGDQAKVAQMKHWLEKVGSPGSQVEKAVFSNERPLQELEFYQFEVKH